MQSSADSRESWWAALHDGTLVGFAADPLDRKLRLDVRLGFPDPQAFGLDRVGIVVEGLSLLTGFGSFRWPGEAPEHEDGMEQSVWEDQLRLYARKGIMRSLSVDEMVVFFSSGDLDVWEANGAIRDGGCEIQMAGTPNRSGGELAHWQLGIAGEALTVEWDGQAHSMEQLLSIANAAWDARDARIKGD